MKTPPMDSVKLMLILMVLSGGVCGFPLDDTDEIDLSPLGAQLYGHPDGAFGEKLRNWNASQNRSNPEELGPYYEGDMLVPINKSAPPSRNGMVSKSYRWPNAVIPYEIVGPYDSRATNMIQNAMNVYHQKTCIKFRRRTSNDRDYISIQNGQSGCWSSIGRVGGAQTVNLQAPACTTVVGTVLHEFMHSAGFMHEQNREERDQYINIMYPNIQRGYESNFVKAQKGQTSGFGVGYDYGSVMHYSATAFSANGKPTIVTKNNAKIGQRDGFSAKDIQKLNNMYGCKKNTKNSTNSNESSSSSSSQSMLGLAMEVIGGEPNQ